MTRRRSGVKVCCVIGAVVVVAAVAFFLMRQMGVVWLQPPLDLSSTRVEISQSDLFTPDVLRKGATHIENDASYMRGCAIDRISYDEPGIVGERGSNTYGTSVTFEMAYTCHGSNTQTMSLPSSGSYECLLQYAPDKSADGTGWVTISQGNG
ncbi:hypothetical protein [Bifidobacterium crudilactis]|jgi:hypothetical protein|uniref:hypothetical protein n=1 Tax=Bifidobacterium crudilactis TaxID=327277 RepID=UPI002F3558DF|nr:hypothetical protein [Bifidobacterium crudilactis]